MRERPCGES